MDKYVIQDRNDGNKYEIKFIDGQIATAQTSDTASDEIIVADLDNSSNHWKIFFYDGELKWESTETVQDDSIILTDQTTEDLYELAVIDGQLGWVDAITGTFHVLVLTSKEYLNIDIDSSEYLEQIISNKEYLNIEMGVADVN